MKFAMRFTLRILLVTFLTSVTTAEKTRDTRQANTGRWGPWSEWSACSRSCGGGVSYQERQCFDLSHTSATGYGCVGESRNYQSCNIQDCPDGSKDFRNEQCGRFNQEPFEGKLYKWMAFHGGPNNCQLNCMPMGEHFYYTQAETVVDGTRCEPDSLDICVAGKCEKVGCDMLLHSDAVLDKCGDCGGDNSTCTTITGVFDITHLSMGYNDILTIPARATSILIQEISPTNNFLALKNTKGVYYLNGDYSIGYPKPIEVAGTIIHYEKKNQATDAPEVIRSIGPITEPLHVMLLTQEDNKGIFYEYSVPNNIVDDGTTTYSWSYGSFGECTKDCGTGHQVRDVFCVRVSNSEEVPDYFCDITNKPTTNQTCNMVLCPASWHVGDWSACPMTCEATGVVQARMVVCERKISFGMYQRVDESECEATLKPASQQACNVDVPCPIWNLGDWSECSEPCGPGSQFRSVSCAEGRDAECTEQKVPPIEQECNIGPCGGLKWFVSEDWSKCAEECGESMQTRQILCVNGNGDAYPDEACTNVTKPDMMQHCTAKKSKCRPRWATSIWTKCSSECGPGMRSRFVFCATFKRNRWIQVPNKRCKGEPPHVMEACDSGPCEEGVWLTSEWTECSQTCGTGERHRDVMCFMNGHHEITAMCNDIYQPISVESCVNKPCKDEYGSGTVDESSGFSDFLVPTEVPITATIPSRRKETTVLVEEVTTAPVSQLDTTAVVPLATTEPEVICNLPKDSGNCRDFSIFWYFDVHYGACNRFWYGGCFGNKNRFATEEDCKAICSHSEEELPQEALCTQPKDVGPCRGSINSFYYNHQSQQCEEFIFGGCLGNANRFRKLRECQFHCSTFHEDPCSQFYDAGQCDGNETKWFYNLYNNECQTFMYSGCGGNPNRFQTIESCQSRCVSVPDTTKAPPTTKPITEVYEVERSSTTEPLPTCEMLPETGPCRASRRKWYYDAIRGQCQVFIYGGCKGNSNNFNSEADCHKVCGGHVETSTKPETTVRITTAPVKVTTRKDVPVRTVKITPPPVRITTGRKLPDVGQQFFTDSYETLGPQTRCQAEREDQSVRGPIGSFVPQCTDEGLYERVQCHGSSGYCFCMNETTGERFQDSYVQFREPDCSNYYRGFVQSPSIKYITQQIQRTTTYSPSWDIDVDVEVLTLNFHNDFDQDFTPSPTLVPVQQSTAAPHVRDEVASTTQKEGVSTTNNVEEVNCSETQFGCCPDGINAASGTNYIGCTDVSPAIIQLDSTNIYTAKQGSTVELVCQVVGTPAPSVYWLRDGLRIEELADNRILAVGGRLRIQGVVASDVGAYECNAFNGVGSISTAVFELDVQLTSRPGGYTGRAMKVIVHKGKNALLPCSSMPNRYPVTIYWQSDKESIPQDDERFTVLENNTLSIRDVQLGDAGSYMCTGRTTYSTVLRKYFTLIVQADVEIYIKPQNVGASFGDTVVFKCASTGSPKPTVYWYLDHVDVINSGRRHIQSNGDLVISGVRNTDAGLYMCVAANGISSKSAEAVLAVFGGTDNPNCVDQDELADCQLVLLASFCNMEPFSEYCCKTCRDNNF